METQFNPARFLAVEGLKDEFKPALLILNQPIPRMDVFERLWKHTEYRLCADGGANRLYDMSHTENPHSCRERYLPTVIHGDLDSLRDEVRDWYAAKGVPISRDPDQYITDFGKAIKKVMAENAAPCKDILILCTLAGRVDQGLGLLYEMLRIQDRYAEAQLRLWLFSESSVSFILPPGRNRLVLPVDEGYFTENVGILPAFGPATISTTGLEWDVTDWPTSVDGNVSTSNHVKAREIIIKTDAKVLFTIERAEKLP